MNIQSSTALRGVLIATLVCLPSLLFAQSQELGPEDQRDEQVQNPDRLQ